MSSNETIDQTLVARTVEMAGTNVESGGKPFACLLVKDGHVVVAATNQVAQTGDVTAHAEITALRAAALQGITDLTGYEMYVTAYPCPMCLGALYYAAPDRVVFAATREQEGEHYDDGNRYMSLSTFYAEYAKPVHEQNLPLVQGQVDDPTEPFRRYTNQHG